MATYTLLSLNQAMELGAAFGLEVASVAAIAAGSVNSNYRLELKGGRRVFARIYEEQNREGAEAEARLLDHLARGGVATPRPLRRRDETGFTYLLDCPPHHATGTPASARCGASSFDPQTRPAALFPWVEGDFRCQALVTTGVARRVGLELAKVHLAGASFAESKPGRFRVEDLRRRLPLIAEARDPEIRAMAKLLDDELSSLERSRPRQLPGGIIHGDLFRDNVLWQGTEPVGLLDFESASDGIWIYDLMVTVLAWCYGADLDLELVRAMFDGYCARRSLVACELDSLCNEGRIAALRFTITRITDFALRAGIGDRVMKDWRRFWARHQRLKAIGNAALSNLCVRQVQGR